jgi:glycosyltransferase involved in cell wall biosynthesis
MKFSVITPSLNQGRFLRDCVESARAQTGVEVEHIVVDACSTDDTVAILKSYPHLLWTSEPDHGQTDAINKGFRRATGDWLMWLNADDYLLPGAFARVAEFAQARPHVDVIYGDSDFVDETGAVVGRKREGDFDFWMLLFYGPFIPSTATFYRRTLIDGGYLLDASQKVCMDFEYYLRLAQAGFRFEHLPEPLACFRWHATNASTVHRSRAIQEFRILQRRYLDLRGLRYLGNELTLRALYAGYQAWRLARRTGNQLFKPQPKATATSLGWWRTTSTIPQ